MARLHKVDDVPAHMGHNRYLLTSYRAPAFTHADCLRSLLWPSNEIQNLWSALVLVIVNVALGVYAVSELHRQRAPGALMAWIATHSAVRALCWVMSLCMHAFSNHASPAVSQLWNDLDYMGIYLSFFAMGGCAIFSSTYCYETRVGINATLTVGTALSFLSTAASFLPQLRTNHLARAAMFSSMVVVYVYPIADYNWHDPNLRVMAVAITLLACGGASMVTRFPERIFPGRFDVVMPSHAVWHWCCLPHDVGVFLFSFSATQQLATTAFVCTPS